MSRHALRSSASLCLLVAFAVSPAHATDYTRSYFVDQILLPTTNTEANSYAIDVDGDNVPDNNFGKVLAALAAQGFDFAGATAAATAAGGIVHSVRLQSTDATFKNDPAAQAVWCVGFPLAAPPLFDGTDVAACDYSESAPFVAALAAGSFTSAAPATTPNPVALDFAMAFGTATTTLPVWNARLSFSTDAAGNITVGQINGSITHDNLMIAFPTLLATSCNDSIQSDPSSDASNNCKSLFDNGCAGFPGYSGDGHIQVCEVAENSVIQALLAPDVQVEDGGTLYDANSVGIRFTAIAYDRVFASGFEP